VTTVVTAGRVFTAGCPLGHFSHVFIDEAGHAMEPEALIALAGELIAVLFIWPNLMWGGWKLTLLSSVIFSQNPRASVGLNTMHHACNYSFLLLT
jgi:hypothetical protein